MKCKLIFLFLILSCQLSLQAQDHPGMADLGDTIFTGVDLFEGSEPLEMTLTFDVKKYVRAKYSEDYIPVDLSLHFNDTIDIKKEVRIKSRGAFRKATCTFAPFWLNIKKADVENEYLQEVKKMKVVTHCKTGDEFEEYIMLEYLAYKIYNLLTPVSFRVRLIKMKYVDTGRKNKASESWAFLIEPESMLVERNEGLLTKNDKLAMAFMRPEEMLRAALFQFLIGNSDYSVTGRHNMKILGLEGFGTEGYTPVPYDFDYAGLVDASYAIPGENLGISSVTQRYYLGPCRENAEYLAGMQYLEDHREEILELIQVFPYLGEKAKNKAIGYIESYFAAAAQPNFIKKDLESTCR